MPIRPLLARPLLVLALSLALAPAFAQQDIDKVNGAITVEAGEHYGDLQTVNGSIKVGASARIASAETVNGSIRVASSVQAGGLSTVNGSIRVDDNVQVNDDVSTVNGSVFIDRGGNVRGNIGTVNGGIGLVDTDVSGDIETVTGDLTVGIGSHVRGGVRYRKPRPSLISFGKQRMPRVIIGPQARVDGPLVFERAVKLYVHRSATIGPVTGATAVRYESDRAPRP